jgi:hypothetical protein
MGEKERAAAWPRSHAHKRVYDLRLGTRAEGKAFHLLVCVHASAGRHLWVFGHGKEVIDEKPQREGEGQSLSAVRFSELVINRSDDKVQDLLGWLKDPTLVSQARRTSVRRRVEFHSLGTAK